VAFLLTLAVVFLAGALMDWIEKKPGRDLLVTIVGTVIGVAVLVFVSVKSYPMDYDAEGNLLVNYADMLPDAFQKVGGFLGFLYGWMLDRRFVHYSVEGTVLQRIIRFVLGIAVTLGAYLLVSKVIKPVIGVYPGMFLSLFLVMFIITGAYPLLVKLVRGKR
jgi:hypothetical protein